MAPEQVIRRAVQVVGEHIDQLAMLTCPGRHEVAGFLKARRLHRAWGKQKPRDRGNNRVTCQLQQMEMEDRV